MAKPDDDGLFDFDGNDAVSRIAAKYCSMTDGNCAPYIRIIRPKGNFRGPSRFELNHEHLPRDAVFTLAPDGIGTKPGLVDIRRRHKTAGWDLCAMPSTDVSRWGGKPVLMTNVLDVRTAGEPRSPQRQAVIDLYAGLYEASMEVGWTIFNGETAIMGPFVGSEVPDPTLPFLWAGVGFGIYRDDRLIDGSRVAAKQYVVAVRECGLRGNGYTDMRKALAARFGEAWWDHPDAQEWIEAAAVPSVIYDKLLADANGWNPHFERIDISYIAHITGGGICDKFGQDAILYFGFDAELSDLYDPLPVMHACKEWLGQSMPAERAYRSNNGGQGLLVVIESEEEALRFIKLAATHGKEARICGRIGQRSDNPKLVIHSKYDGAGEVVYTRSKT